MGIAAVLALLSVGPPAAAQGTVALSEGDTVLGDCLDVDACAERVTRLMSETMIEYGYGLQHDALATSALGGKGNGLVAEVGLDSLPLGPRNELARQVPLLPVLPRVGLGYQIGSFTHDAPYPQYAVGAHAMPPISIAGASAWSVGGGVSAAWPLLRGHLLWLGGEVDYGYARVAAPVVGSPADLAQIEELEAYVDPTLPGCQGDCMDVFAQHSVGGRAGMSVEPVPAVFAHAKLGLVWLAQGLQLGVDGSRWSLGGLQPQIVVGGGIRPGDTYQLASSLVLAPMPAEVRTDDVGTLTKITVSMSYRFGPPRYWEKRQPEET